jgi:transposase InsO family protein
MPWKEWTVDEGRQEFVKLASVAGANVSELCGRFGISRKTGHKWLRRFRLTGAVAEQSRRPRHSPTQTALELEQAIVALRGSHPAWGGRKLRRRLQDLGLGIAPAASTITEILRRRQLLGQPGMTSSEPWQRFARSEPNDLWQMDFKGHVPCRDGRCHPLTALDDCSRYALILRACGDERRGTVQAALSEAFIRYGLPWEMLMDNGSPWGSGEIYTRLTIWLMRLGIVVGHGRPRHPQTQGKEERFHRTVKAELIGQDLPWPLVQCQSRFDQWRDAYNTERPHEALQMETPIQHYRISPRAFPDTLPAIDYAPGDEIRKVQAQGWVDFHGRPLRLSKALRGQPVAFRANPHADGKWSVFFCRQKIIDIDLNPKKENPESVTHVPEQV